MSRPSVVVRVATPADLPVLVVLWSQLRELGRDPAARSVRSPNTACVAGAEERLCEVIRSDACRVVVAEVATDAAGDGGTGPATEVVGMAILSDTRVGQLMDLPAVQLTHVIVAEGRRRHGVGRALVSAAVSYAEERCADEIVVSVYPALREANRFYARLGFAPLVVRRIAPVGALRRRLAALDHRSAGLIRRPGRPARTGLSLRPKPTRVGDATSAVVDSR